MFPNAFYKIWTALECQNLKPLETCNEGEIFCEPVTLDIRPFYPDFDTSKEFCILNTFEQLKHLNSEMFNRNKFPDLECPSGFEWSFDQCINKNECNDKNNNFCRSNEFCIDYIGDGYCYSEFVEEAKMCHHKPERVSEEFYVDGPFCSCFPGSSALCGDMLGCDCGGKSRQKRWEGDQKVVSAKRSKRSTSRFSSNFHLSDTNRKTFLTKWLGQQKIQPRSYRIESCSKIANAFQLFNKCYKMIKISMDLSSAVEKCNSINGKLAVVENRKVWYNLSKKMFGGFESFWINDYESDDKLSYVHVVNRNDLNDGFGLVANYYKDLRNYPPQWDIVDRREKHKFFCEFN